jgi:hypothetical protein
MSLEYVLSIYLLAHRVIMDKTQRRDLHGQEADEQDVEQELHFFVRDPKLLLNKE